MFIYLDTSQLSEIADHYDNTLDENGGKLSEFFSRWKLSGFKLCISLQHLGETAALKSKQNREIRLKGLSNFPDIRFSRLGWPSMIEREAISEMLKQLPIKYRYDNYLDRDRIWEKTDVSALLRYQEDSQERFLKSRRINEAASEIEEMWKPMRNILGKYSRRTIKSLDTPITIDIRGAKTIIEQLRSADKSDGPSVIFLENVYRTIEETGSLSRSLIRLSRLEGLSGIEKRYLSDTGSLAVFYRLAREAIPIVARRSRISEADVSQLIDKIDLSACPGFSLRRALFRALQSSDKKLEASDWLDAAHLTYAPYVDYFFADKRTYELLRQETRSHPFQIPEFLISNIRRVVPLEKLLKQLPI
jgi:hypothetical protein